MSGHRLYLEALAAPIPLHPLPMQDARAKQIYENCTTSNKELILKELSLIPIWKHFSAKKSKFSIEKIEIKIFNRRVLLLSVNIPRICAPFHCRSVLMPGPPEHTDAVIFESLLYANTNKPSMHAAAEIIL